MTRLARSRSPISYLSSSEITWDAVGVSPHQESHLYLLSTRDAIHVILRTRLSLRLLCTASKVTAEEGEPTLFLRMTVHTSQPCLILLPEEIASHFHHHHLTGNKNLISKQVNYKVCIYTFSSSYGYLGDNKGLLLYTYFISHHHNIVTKKKTTSGVENATVLQAISFHSLLPFAIAHLPHTQNSLATELTTFAISVSGFSVLAILNTTNCGSK